MESLSIDQLGLRKSIPMVLEMFQSNTQDLNKLHKYNKLTINKHIHK